MYQRHLQVIATVAFLAAAFWTSDARAGKVMLCLAPDELNCRIGSGTNHYDKFVKLSSGEKASVSRALEAAQAFCKSSADHGKQILKTFEQPENNDKAHPSHYYEFDCDRKL
jgi:hypothetical protein